MRRNLLKEKHPSGRHLNRQFNCLHLQFEFTGNPQIPRQQTDQLEFSKIRERIENLRYEIPERIEF